MLKISAIYSTISINFDPDYIDEALYNYENDNAELKEFKPLFVHKNNGSAKNVC